MRIKRLYLLIIFIFSLILTNIHYSQSKPPLLDYKEKTNIILLAENNNSTSQEIISVDLSADDISFISSNYYKTFIPLVIFSVVVLLEKGSLEKQKFKIRKFQGVKGIVNWYRVRVLRI